MKKVFRGALLPLAAVFFLSACSESQREWLARFFKVGGSAVPVAVEQVVLREKEATQLVPAVVTASEKVDVRLPYEAHIDKVFVNIGDSIKAGMPLCRLSEEDVSFRLAQSRTDLRDALSLLEKNTYILRNRDRLFDEGRIDKTQYDGIEAEVAANESAAEGLRNQITQLETQSANLVVASPASGVVQARTAAPGLVIPEKQSLFTITKVDPVSIVFSLAPYEARSVRQDMPVLVKFRELPGEAVAAKVTSVGTAINMDTGRFDVAVELANPNSVYKIGMTAQVEFAGAEKQKFFQVPSEAVITDNRKQYVFTVSMGVAHKVPVVLKEMRQDYSEIIEGLEEGDLVVVKGNKQLKDGSVVDIWGR